ncbi:MAG: 6-phosphogluconolactonase [Pirellulales bacterium]|nr:6-phosphogluconolactonase [Pirellulales bacterium]
MKPHELTAVRDVDVCQNPDELAARAVKLITQAAHEAIEDRGQFTLTLSGGSTPMETYLLLAHFDRSTPVVWPHTCVFFSDERLVPPDDPRSNFGMAQKSLLDRVKIPPSQIFPVPTEAPSAAEAAARYAETMVEFFSPSDRTHPPRFDLILLGMGEDGHTASLLPHTDALAEEKLWATWTPPDNATPRVERITMTYLVLNAARQVVFLVTGAKKAVALWDVLEGCARREDRPAAGIRPTDGRVTWIVDQEAARLLTKK